MSESVSGGEIVPFDEIVRRLDICRATAYKAARCGDLPAIRIGKRLIVLREPFERLLRDGNASGPSEENRPAQ